MSRLIIAEPNKNSVKSNIQRMSTPASPKYYSKSVQEPWFSYIKSGTKTIEGRLCKGDFAIIRAGDYITWTRAETEDRPTKTRAETEDQSIKTQIKAIYHHKTFATYLKARTLSACLPGVKTIHEGVTIYHGFYSRADEKKYGICAIELMLIN